MDNDYTFVRDLTKLEQLSFADLTKLSKGDVSDIAFILRKFFVDGTALVHLISKTVGAKVFYEINDNEPPSPKLASGVELVAEVVSDGIDPVGRAGTRPIKVKANKVLSYVVVKWQGSDYTVLDIIKYVCHDAGAVHATPENPATEEAKHLRELASFLKFNTNNEANEYMNPALMSLPAVGRVVCRGLSELKQVVERRLANEPRPR